MWGQTGEKPGGAIEEESKSEGCLVRSLDLHQKSEVAVVGAKVGKETEGVPGCGEKVGGIWGAAVLQGGEADRAQI